MAAAVCDAPLLKVFYRVCRQCASVKVFRDLTHTVTDRVSDFFTPLRTVWCLLAVMKELMFSPAVSPELHGRRGAARCYVILPLPEEVRHTYQPACAAHRSLPLRELEGWPAATVGSRRASPATAAGLAGHEQERLQALVKGSGRAVRRVGRGATPDNSPRGPRRPTRSTTTTPLYAGWGVAASEQDAPPTRASPGDASAGGGRPTPAPVRRGGPQQRHLSGWCRTTASPSLRWDKPPTATSAI